MTLKIAHRGARGYERENTLESINKAIDMNADIIEIDVRCKYGGVVLSHDKPKDYGLVSLDRALNCIGKRAITKIDLKEDDLKLLYRVLNIIFRRRFENNIIFTSNYKNNIKRIKEIAPYIKSELGGFEHQSIKTIIKNAKEVNADIVGVHTNITTKKKVETIHKAGLEIHTWPVDNKRKVRKFIKYGVDGITTKYPDLW